MDQPELKIVRRRPGGSGAASRWTVVAVAVGLSLAALLATLGGADEARRVLPSRQLAESAVERSLEKGSDDAEVRATVLKLRRSLARRPLDCRTRVIYAGLILGLSRSLEDTRAAAFHAGLAAELAPVTVPIVRVAALVLARSRQLEASLSWIRRTFGPDPQAAASLLAEVEPLLYDGQLERGLADTPQAWLAWAEQLRGDGRIDEADDWLARSHERWPRHLPTLRRLADRAASRDDDEALIALFPPGLELPREPEAASVRIYAAWSRGLRGETTEALREIDDALTLGDGRSNLRILAGDAYAALGEHEAAKHVWNVELHSLRGPAVGARLRLLVRLAGVEDRHGQPAAALRLWRAVLELDPEHARARRRIDELTGFRRLGARSRR